jgi:hypothetical protein
LLSLGNVSLLDVARARAGCDEIRVGSCTRSPPEGANVTPHKRYRPAVERLEPVNLMSAIPGAEAQPAVHAAVENVVRIHGTVGGTIIDHKGRDLFGGLEGTLTIDGVAVQASVRGSVGELPNKSIGGVIHITTDQGDISAGVTSRFEYKIVAGTKDFAHASGKGTFHVNFPLDGDLTFR